MMQLRCMKYWRGDMNDNIENVRKLLQKELNKVIVDIETDIQKIRNIKFSCFVTGDSYKESHEFIINNMKQKIEYLSEITSSIQACFNFTSYEV